MENATAIGATLGVSVLLHGCLLTAQNQAEPPPPTTGSVALDGDEHPTIGDALGRIRLGDWFERLDVIGFASVRAFDTGRGGARPDGAVGVDQATLFLDAGVRDVGSIYCELRIERLYDADTTGVGTGELYLSLPGLVRWGDSSLGLKVGRFDFRFGEYYMLEDAHLNRTISYPASLPYQFDEGVLATAQSGAWTFDVSLSDGTRSRNSSTGVAPAVTGRVRWQPTPSLLASVSGYQAGEAPLSALGFNASLAGPVSGAAAGSSTSTEVRLTAGCADLIAEPIAGIHLQAQAGAARVGDDDTAFGRTFYWWTVEPWLDLGPATMLVARYSGVGTYDDEEGYRFEGRPFANAGASYGFDLRSLDRLSLGVRHVFVPGLIGKLELGRDRLTGTRTSGLPDDERSFVAAELVLVF
jgi:hypothetical protein